MRYDPEFQKFFDSRMTSFYNRLSVEYDIPLDIAKAIVTSGYFHILVAVQAEVNKEPMQRSIAVHAWSSLWVLYGKAHGVSPARIESMLDLTSSKVVTLITEMRDKVRR